jgi:DNA-3-methyladenine glycosylase
VNDPIIDYPPAVVTAIQHTPYLATPVATTNSQQIPSLPQSFFARPAKEVAPDLTGCLLVKLQPTGEQLWGVIVETEAYS